MRNEKEHPVAQAIISITVHHGNLDHTAVGAMYPEAYPDGHDGITAIEACTKSGMYADIPYVRIWKEDIAVAEFCQHQLAGVYFKDAKFPSEGPF